MIKVNTKGATTKDFETIDAIIDLETKRKINKVKGAEHLGIRTACFIDGEFVLISKYDFNYEIYNKLKKA